MLDADPFTRGRADDVAQVFVFLASSSARAIHGAAIAVPGLS